MAPKGSDRPDPTTLLTASGDKTSGGPYSLLGPAFGPIHEDSRESTPLSQASQYSDYFGNSQRFWTQAAEDIGNEVRSSTPSTSLSSAATNGSRPSSCSRSKQSLSGPTSTLTSHGPIASNMLKRTASQASIEPGKLGHETKKPRTDPPCQYNTSSPGSTQTDPPFINLSPPHILQRFIESRKLPYSVQWELARLVSKGAKSWEGPDAITVDELNGLKSRGDAKMSHSEGARNFTRLFYGEKQDGPFASWNEDERRATDPWPELEREEVFAAAHPEIDHLDEQGGKVHFLAALKKVTNTPKTTATAGYKIELGQAQLGTSNSFSRRFGSRSFLRLKVPTNILHRSGHDLLDYLRKPVILCQSIFRSFYAKEQTVFYFRTNEVWNPKLQTVSSPPPSAPGLGLLKFIEWHNPIELNRKQTMAKWAARFALGLSSSIHGITLKEEDIQVIEDIKSKEGSDMTDGAGFITRHLLQELTVLHDWPSRPSAIQVRIRGSKGLLIENLDLKDDIRSVQLRPSLIKVHYPTPLDKTHTTIDILRTSHARSPIPISADVIVNLHANGVRSCVLKELMRKSLEDIVQPLLKWDLDDPKTMLELWINFERAGSVVKSRRAREDIALARVRGFTELDTTEEVVEDDEEANELEQTAECSEDWWPDRVSGCPSPLEETVIEFLDSGFQPTTCRILREKAFKAVQSTINRVISNHVINIPLSAGAWIIPDPSGLLEPGQVFFQSSQQKLIALDGTETGIVTGDVLITRDPCRLPSDVQKWKAVDIDKLHPLKDVIVLSVRGPRRAADWLAGGDYDGDKAKLIWQPELVSDFKNADPRFADPPANLNSFFEVENKQVSDFLTDVENYTEEQKINQLQKYLLGAMENASTVGMYSNFHNYSTYVNGYADEQTKLLAYMFTTVLDGRKTGKTVRQDIFKDHNRRFGDRKLKWKEAERKRGEHDLALGYNVLRAKSNPNFIMDKLVSYGQELRNEMLHQIEKKMQSYPNDMDPDLIQPYLELKQKIQDLRSAHHDILADAYQADLSLIEKHVEEVYEQHRKAKAHQSSTTTPGAGFTSLSISRRQDVLRKFSKMFHSNPDVAQLLLIYSQNEVDRIKASYAYYHDSVHPPQSRFPWDVAFRVLCSIKCGRHVKSVDRHFYDYMVIKLPKHRKHSL